MEIITQSARETQTLGERFATDLKPGEILALYGELGSGKTTFIQGLAKGLGIKDRVISPTFVFLRQYPVNQDLIKRFNHIDLYRINQAKEAKGLGLEEIFTDEEGITVIEWADRIEKLLPQKRINLYFEYLEENKRKIKIKR